MKVAVLCTLVALAVALSLPTSHAENGKGTTPKRKLSELSQLQQFLVKMTNTELLKKNGKLDKSILREYFGIMELYQIDLPSLILYQATMGNSVPFPDMYFDYYEVIEFPPWFTLVLEGEYNSENSTIVQIAEDTSFKTTLNGNRFKMEFYLPKYEWTLPFTHRMCINGGCSLAKDFTFFVKDYSLQLSGEFGTDLNGLRLHNIDFRFYVGEITTTIQDWIFDDGENYGPIVTPLGGYLMEAWEDIEEEFKINQQTWINCFLTNGRISPPKCDKYINEEMFRQNFAQIIHAIGLGKLHEYGNGSKN